MWDLPSYAGISKTSPIFQRFRKWNVGFLGDGLGGPAVGDSKEFPYTNCFEGPLSSTPFDTLKSCNCDFLYIWNYLVEWQSWTPPKKRVILKSKGVWVKSDGKNASRISSKFFLEAPNWCRKIGSWYNPIGWVKLAYLPLLHDFFTVNYVLYENMPNIPLIPCFFFGEMNFRLKRCFAHDFYFISIYLHQTTKHPLGFSHFPPPPETETETPLTPVGRFRPNVRPSIASGSWWVIFDVCLGIFGAGRGSCHWEWFNVAKV